MAANVVGYYNVAAPANHKVLLGNQLHTTNDTLVGVIRNPGRGATFFKYNGAYTGFTFDDIDLAWNGITMVLAAAIPSVKLRPAPPGSTETHPLQRGRAEARGNCRD
jgi:hypothetical protein